MKKQILAFICGVAVALSITMVPAVADSISKKINVLVDYVTVTLDGEKVDVKNFVHEGSTYLGLRDTAELLGLQVDWDDKTQTAVLTSPGKTPVFPRENTMQTIDVPIVILKDTTMTVNGNVIDPAFITKTKDSYKASYPNITDEELKSAIKEAAAWETFKKEMFAKYDLKNTEEDTKEAEQSYNDMVESYGGAEAFDLILVSNNLKADEFKADYIKSYLENKLITPLSENLKKDSKEIQDFTAEKKAEFEKDKTLANFPVATVKHILIQDEKEAKDALSQLKKGVKFEKLLEKYKENDPGMPETGYEVYIGSGFVPEFEEAAVKLTKGKYSDVVQSDYGYHILYCLEKSETITFEEYFEMNFGSQVSQMLDSIVTNYIQNADVQVEWGF